MNGWSLVELMVALAVGAIVALFATSLMAGSGAALAAQADAATLEDTGNYVLATVGRAVRQAGWGLAPAPGVAGSDAELAIVFAGAADGSMLNCAGMAETGGSGASVFRLDGEVLRCRYRTGDSWSAQAMAHGVGEFVLRYGVDTDTPRDGLPNRWMAADAVAEWERVTSVHLAFALKGKHTRQAFSMRWRLENLP